MFIFENVRFNPFFFSSNKQNVQKIILTHHQVSICHYILKTFIYELVNCKSNKKKYVFKFTSKLFIFHTTCVPLIILNGYSNKYNYNCLSDNTICLQLFYSQATCHHTAWITTKLINRFILPFYSPTHLV